MFIQMFRKPIKPFRLLVLLAMYLLGAGLVQYVEQIRDWMVLIQGAVFLVLVTLAFWYLKMLGDLNNPRNWQEGIKLKKIRQIRWAAAVLSAALLTVAVTLFINWMLLGILWQGVSFLLIGFFVAAVLDYIFHFIPAVRPYGVLIEMLSLVVFPPAAAFFLQAQTPHSFLTMSVIGFAPLYIAFRILNQLENFGPDQSAERKTLVTVLGWEKAMVLHNALILLGYVLMALVTLLSFPLFMMWPVFLTLPIGLLEIVLMERVRRGAKPIWRGMRLAMVSIILLPIYLLAFAFWIR